MNNLEAVELIRKATKAPWQAGLNLPWVANNDPRTNILWRDSQAVTIVYSQWVSEEENCANALLIALARNAEDVMMRRGWTAVSDCAGGWFIDASTTIDEDDWHTSPFEKWLVEKIWPHPFIALVEADEWYKANVEKR